jgi:hypothetical protein
MAQVALDQLLGAAQRVEEQLAQVARPAARVGAPCPGQVVRVSLPVVLPMAPVATPAEAQVEEDPALAVLPQAQVVKALIFCASISKRTRRARRQPAIGMHR